MFEIQKKDYGYQITFDGFIEEDEMKQWVEESKTTLLSSPSSFNVLIDMRTLKPLPAESQKYMQVGQKLYKEHGMKKSVVIVDSALTKMQFQRIAKETGIYEWERYIDASKVTNWEKVGIDWLTKDIDPDK